MVKDNIRNLRIAAGLSQEELSSVLNVSYKTISHWETGYTEPPIAIIIQLKRFFNVSYEEILE